MTENDRESYIQDILTRTYKTLGTTTLKIFMDTPTSVRDGGVKECLQKILTEGDFLERVRALALCADSKFFDDQHAHDATTYVTEQLFPTYGGYILAIANLYDLSFNPRNSDNTIKGPAIFLKEFTGEHSDSEVFFVMLKAIEAFRFVAALP